MGLEVTPSRSAVIELSEDTLETFEVMLVKIISAPGFLTSERDLMREIHTKLKSA